MTDDPRTDLATQLRMAADLLDDQPDLPTPTVTGSRAGRVDIDFFLMVDHPDDLAAQKAAAQRIIGALGGRWDKSERGGDLDLTQARGSLHLLVSVRREAVCERVVTGTETVTVPAVEAQPERVETRDVVEWRCLPLLAEGAA